jgi:hypothetical protein
MTYMQLAFVVLRALPVPGWSRRLAQGGQTRIGLRRRPYVRTARRQPAWWLLYLCAATPVALVAAADTVAGPSLARQMLEIVAVVIGFALMAIWVTANRVALLEHDHRAR